MKDKTIDLYTPDQHAETTEWITDMAIRFNVRGNDVIRAMWTIAKGTVWAKLALDAKEKKEQMKKEGAKAK